MGSRKILVIVGRRIYWFKILGKFGGSGIEDKYIVKCSFFIFVNFREVFFRFCVCESLVFFDLLGLDCLV